MARRAAEILRELTEIHIAVDESADATPYQEKWGDLTAELTLLHRMVLQTGYPPPDVLAHLQGAWLPELEDAIASASRALEEHQSVESGFGICQAEAQAIYDHLAQARDDSSSE